MSKKKTPTVDIQEWFSDIEKDFPPVRTESTELGIEGSSAWSWECNPQGDYTKCSIEVENVIGLAQTDFINQSIISKAIAPESRKLLSEVLESKNFPAEIPVSMITSNGEKVNVIFTFLGYISDKEYIHGFTRLAEDQTIPVAESAQPPAEEGLSKKKSLQYSVIVFSSIGVVAILAIITLVMTNGLLDRLTRQANLPAESTASIQAQAPTITIQAPTIEPTNTPAPTMTEEPIPTSTIEEEVPTPAPEDIGDVEVLSDEKYLDKLAYYADIFSGADNLLVNLNHIQRNVPDARCPSSMEWNNTLKTILPSLKTDLSVFQSRSISVPPKNLAHIYSAFISASASYNQIIEKIENYVNSPQCEGRLVLEDDLGRGRNALDNAIRQLNMARCKKSVCEVSIVPVPPRDSCPNIKSRLAPGLYAYVSTLNKRLTVQVRRDPSVDSGLLYNVDNGGIVQVIDGYKCADDWIWWKVRGLKSGITGWAAERSSAEYWLLPITP